jgi:alkylated DNA repair dioxygenase AlkB
MWPAMGRSRTASPQPALFAFARAQPEGLVYRDDVLSPAEEQVLLAAFAALPLRPFEFHGHLGKRRIVSYGFRYEHGGRALSESEPLPDFLLPLRRRAAAFAGVPEAGLRQAMVTEYAPGAGIGWHRDKPMFADIIAFSLGAACMLRFRRQRGAGWERASRQLRPRSAYLLRGAARWEWQHSIAPMTALRYSVTFRNFVERS